MRTRDRERQVVADIITALTENVARERWAVVLVQAFSAAQRQHVGELLDAEREKLEQAIAAVLQ